MTHRGKIREFPSVLFVASVARFLSSAIFRLGFTPLGFSPWESTWNQNKSLRLVVLPLVWRTAIGDRRHFKKRESSTSFNCLRPS